MEYAGHDGHHGQARQSGSTHCYCWTIARIYTSYTGPCKYGEESHQVLQGKELESNTTIPLTIGIYITYLSIHITSNKSGC